MHCGQTPCGFVTEVAGTEALRLYRVSIDGARSGGFANDEGMAAERAGEYALRIELPELARAYFREAHYAYRKWGAVTRQRALERRFGGDVRAEAGAGDPDTLTASGSGGSSENSRTSPDRFDLRTILKSSQTLSGEIVLERLLERMIDIALENAGARRGVLILERAGRSEIVAEKSVDASRAARFERRPLETADDLSVGIVSYAIRTRESVVLNEATADKRFGQDPYVLREKPRSVLCAIASPASFNTTGNPISAAAVAACTGVATSLSFGIRTP